MGMMQAFSIGRLFTYNSFMAKLTFCTGVGTVTGANFLLETDAGTKILVDCGLVQGERVATEENSERFPYDLSTITALFITHAHLDHVGRIPKIVKDGYRGPIYSTPQTLDLARLVLEDGVNIIAQEARQEGTAPLYGPADVQAIFPQWKTIEYHEAFELTPDVSIFLKDAGHILGSSMVEVTVKAEGDIGEGDLRARPARARGISQQGNIRAPESMSLSAVTKVLFTGDLGNSPAPLLRDTEPVGDVDYLVMESVYGDRNHEDREGRSNMLRQVILDSVSRGGTLVIPAFAIDRTQVLLYELNNLVEQKKIPSVPIFVDSPLAIKATDVYKANEDLFNDTAKAEIARGDDPFSFPHLEYTLTKNESDDIGRAKGAKIILAGSGMSVGGRIVSHEAEYLPDANSTILLVGYQAAGSLGRELADGAKKVRIHHETIKVRAKIETLYGYSAHKDGDHLVEFVSTAGDDAGKGRLKQVFTVMGEPKAAMHLAQRINDELGVKAVVPERLKEYEL